MNDQPQDAKKKLLPLFLLILLVLNILLLTRVLNKPVSPENSSFIFQQNTPVNIPFLNTGDEPISEQPLQPAQDTNFLPVSISEQNIILLSMSDGYYSHLFAYQPEVLPITRITNGNWDDIHPSIHPTGTKIAYSSKQNGSWDIYIMDLSNGNSLQVTDSPQYDGSPLLVSRWTMVGL